MGKYTLKRPSKQLSDGTIEIVLTKGQSAIIDSVDSDLAEFNWQATRGRMTFYATRATGDPNQRTILLHRVILSRILNRELQSDEFPDHIDNNGLNCTRSNIRLATKAENARNRKKATNNTSGYKGVGWESGKWAARIGLNYKNRFLGLFDTPEEAREAYKKAAIELHGEFARFE